MSTNIEGFPEGLPDGIPNGFPDGSSVNSPDAGALERLANELFKAMPGEMPSPAFSPHLEDHPRAQKMLGIIQQEFDRGQSHSSGHQRFHGWESHSSGYQRFDRGPSHGHQNFDLNEPQTSLPDPHFTDGKVPPSAAGVGVSPGDALPSYYFLNETFAEKPHIPGASNFLPHSFSPFSLGNIHVGSDRDQLGRAVQSPIGRIPFDVNRVRADFPVFRERVNDKPLIWFDNAATTQKPKQVIDRISYFYEHENSNIHRAAHELAARATDAYEAAREKVRAFVNARSVNEIVFTRGTTEAINLVAKTWGDQNLHAGDEIIVSHLEHHANIVPWKQLADKKGLVLRVIPVDDDGQILLDAYAGLLNSKTKLVSFTQVSNALGTVTPSSDIIRMAHAAGAKVLLDGAQSVSHMRTDVTMLDCDWFVFSGHKVFGPTGIGALYGKEDILNATQPWQGGGNMIVDVTFEHIRYHNAPSRFEAGTGNIADAVGLGAALDYVNRLGIENIYNYESFLLEYATGLIKHVPGLRLIGTAKHKASVLSFVLDGYKTEEVGAALNKEGIAVRSGHHCAQPILRRFGLETTVRPSLAFYNTCEEIDVLIGTLHRLAASGRGRRA
ncbi:family 2A encapsulin nanocompartment cargo protein cysteine desulfurase [Dyadobacter fermentans]|uniref:cysteine desulfurase n=1 Tax=Dyadobacter fermentans (strain ATCC 700827 / DSM 18053 / CIP 107007 / KCTC 52180 / NS114) TaxID=471854 RepID=C6VXB9_DYAFD|nr:family 2A encapsulin nanocompartment cargo protein cysteine desulfurase [Dyadobacter fermentans]ACT93262.1 cysteine desulfurase, SufS subfamily [Dyadobacter fermentans DSM 18053]